MEKLRTLLNSMTTEQQQLFADSCNTTVGYLRKEISERGLLNPKLCVNIERESLNEVTRQDLRPNDWPAIWPELIEK